MNPHCYFEMMKQSHPKITTYKYNLKNIILSYIYVCISY